MGLIMSVLMANKRNQYMTVRVSSKEVIAYIMQGYYIVKHSAIKA